MISSACTAPITCEIIQKYNRLMSNILRWIKGVRFKREDRKGAETFGKLSQRTS